MAGPKTKKFKMAKIKKILAENTVKSIEMEQAPQIVFTTKRCGTLHLLRKYRKFTTDIELSPYSTASIDKFFASMNKATILSILDANKG